MYNVIVPCAGLSTRYPGTLPKFLLTCHDGKMMLENVINQYIDKYPIYITVLKEHDENFNVIKRLRYIFKNKINITILESKTTGSADTVYQTLLRNNITGTILVRDCDTFFNHPIEETGNQVYCSHIDGYSKLTQKSYVEANEQDIITNIVEKRVISEFFCVGGYQFDSAKKFIKTYESLKNISSEAYISAIISRMLSDEEVFLKKVIDDFIDLNDLEQFDKYNDKPTYFCDIDGVICKAQSRYDDMPFVSYEPIKENVEVLLSEQKRGCKFIFTTARDIAFFNETNNMLIELGFIEFRLLMNITRSKRIVINDYDRLYPTCGSICVKSNVPELRKFL